MTTTSIPMGLPGVEITPGDHICAFYRGAAQRDEVLLPFLARGLTAGDRCICVLDSRDTEQVTKPLSLAVDIDRPLSSGQFDLLPSDEAYLSGGSFSPERMLDFWELGVGRAIRAGYSFVRAAGEMTWALRGLSRAADLVRYEARLNRFLPRYPQVILCLYDLERFTDGQLLMEMLRTHPKVLMSGQLLDNPWYVEPDDGDADA